MSNVELSKIVELSKTELAKYNYIVVVDASGSMAFASTKIQGIRRIDEVRETIIALSNELQSIDDDGIDIIIFNASVNTYRNVTLEKINEIFQNLRPMGSTDTTAAVKEIRKLHEASDKPTVALVFTDGEPDNAVTLEKEIIDLSNSLNADEDLAIGFIQVANDEKATAALKALDDDLVAKGAKFDIVDTTPQALAEQLTIVQLISKTLQD